eukprot:TRINITY_DN10513_c0_g1_i1.p1 TRINITY_DN10513_c0_g1~~TRINITY_DN10513_c0_g1_i1.p1  ORF type:complete len:704 (-),score=146.87 TRINITY_DN10513_c0_g1_i1:48-2159(-)
MSQMDRLIPVINKLQDVFNAVGSSNAIDLPQIVVVGSQSSGKSSVLENIVGRDFLPRGSGIVTRRPLVLQLNKIPADHDDEYEEWGEFVHRPNQLFTNFNEIRDEISRETDRLVGQNKGISNNAITLKIYSPHVLNLTLVDLPGMTRVPVGDQPADIEQQIRNMILNYIARPNSIILAVTAGNSDLANSDALQLAKLVDPDGDRTLGVLTKLDIKDKGTDVMDILNGEVFRLKLGFIGVVNRSQKDIVSGKSIPEALDSEADFFASHPKYGLVAHKMGTPYLARRLNVLLLDHIREKLPNLRKRINEMFHETERELSSYGSESLPNHTSPDAMLLQIITNFTNSYKDAINGQVSDPESRELYGGARINYIFTEYFSAELKNMDALDGLTTNDIRNVIRNATGPRNALFIPEVSFELLVKKQIARLEQPSLQCVDYVYDELISIVNQSETKELIRYEKLHQQVVDETTKMLQDCRTPTRRMINHLLNIELAYINTAHPDFIGTGGVIHSIVDNLVEEREQQRRAEIEQQMAIEHQRRQAAQAAAQGKAPRPTMNDVKIASKQASDQLNETWDGISANNPFNRKSKKRGKVSLDYVPQTIRSEGELSESEKFDSNLIQRLLVSYFDIVRKNIMDTIPKSIMHYLVNKSLQKIQNHLVSKLYKQDQIEELLSESPEITRRRKKLHQVLKRLKKAKEILSEVRDIEF